MSGGKLRWEQVDPAPFSRWSFKRRATYGLVRWEIVRIAKLRLYELHGYVGADRSRDIDICNLVSFAAAARVAEALTLAIVGAKK